MKNKIKINNKFIGPNQPVFIIAEAGVNHNGSMRLAKKMIDAANRFGADAIKFQSFKAEELVTESAPKARYQISNAKNETQFKMLKRLEIDDREIELLFRYAKKKGIILLSTPFDSKSAGMLNRIGMPIFKISSGDLTNYLLLDKVASYQKPIILSTGMATMKEVAQAVKCIEVRGNRKIALLHCTSNYPADYNNINLSAMKTMGRRFKLPVGYSDHTPGIEIAIAAVALGAGIVEKHFTLDKNLPGPDHKASLTPDEFGELVTAVRNVERAMGDGIKKPARSEREIRKVARRSLVAAVDIQKGSKLLSAMIAVKRPGTGIGPKYYDRLIGKKAKRLIRKDELFSWSQLT